MTFDELKLREQETYIEKKMQDLLVQEGQLIHQRSELETQQKLLCSLLNSSPIEFDERLFFFLISFLVIENVIFVLQMCRCHLLKSIVKSKTI